MESYLKPEDGRALMIESIEVRLPGHREVQRMGWGGIKGATNKRLTSTLYKLWPNCIFLLFVPPVPGARIPKYLLNDLKIELGELLSFTARC